MKYWFIFFINLLEYLSVPDDPDFGLAHDFELQIFGQQDPPIDEHSKSLIHFGVHVVTLDESGQLPINLNSFLIQFKSC